MSIIRNFLEHCLSAPKETRIKAANGMICVSKDITQEEYDMIPNSWKGNSPVEGYEGMFIGVIFRRAHDNA